MKYFLPFLLLISLGAFAQKDSIQSPSHIPAAIVSIDTITTTLLSPANGKLTSTKLELLPGDDINISLQNFSGVQMQTRGSWGVQSDLVIDGSTFEQSMVMIQGIKAYETQTGHLSMNLPIPFCAIKEMDLMRGAQGKNYGIGGLAGAVDFKLKSSGQFTKTYFGTNFQKDTSSGNLYYQAGIMTANTIHTENSDFLLSANIDTANGYRYNSGSAKYQLLYNSKHHIVGTSSEISLMAALSNATFGARDFYVSPYDKEAHEQVKNNMESAIWTSKIRDWKSRALIYNRNGFDHYVYDRFRPTIYQNYHNTNTLGLEEHLSRQNRYGMMSMGLELRQEKIKSTNLGEHQRGYYGLMLSQSFQDFKIENLNFTPAAYIGYNVLNGFQLYPGIKIDYGFTRQKGYNYLSFDIGRGLRNPSFTDLYYQDSGNKGNPNLVAENGYTYYMQYQYLRSKISFYLTGFYRDVNNYITWNDINPSPDTTYWYPENNRQVGTYGISPKLQLWQQSILENRLWLNAAISYQYMNVSDQLSNSKNEIQILKNQFISSLTLGSDRWALTTNYRYQQQLNNYSYNVVDMRILYRINKNFRLTFDITNLLSEQYEVLYVPMPGSFYRLGLEFHK